MERDITHELEDNSLVFEFTQPDGGVARIDFGIDGGFGDFAIKHLGKHPPENYFYAYWTSTPGLLEYFFQVIGRQPDASVQVAQLEELAAQRSLPLHRTDEGEGKLTPHSLRSIADVAAKPRDSERYELTADSVTSSVLVLEDTLNGTVVAMDREWDDDERLTYGFVVPHDQTWRFLAGCMLKSYNDDDQPWPRNTRYPTSEYEKALDAFKRGLDTRAL